MTSPHAPRDAAHRLRSGRVPPRGLCDVPEGARLDLAKLYQTLLAKGQLAGYEVAERFYEIGSVAGLQEFRALMATKCCGKTMTFTDQFLDEASAVIRDLDRPEIEGAGGRDCRDTGAGRQAVHPGRGRERGQCLARGQRLSQVWRDGSLRADRQR